MGRVYCRKRRKPQKSCEWLKDKPFLPTSGLTVKGIDLNAISTVADHRVVFRSVAERFQSPVFLIRENSELPSDLWLKGDLTFHHKIIGINSPKNEETELKAFAKTFKNTEMS